MLPGYHGRYLRIDPRPGRTKCISLEEHVLRSFLGGVGLGAWILAQETQAGVDPVGCEAALVFALSPLVGSPLTTSAKFAVVAFSPLTGRVCDALSSSHFAIAAKRAGVDALVVTGVCDEPSVVLIDGTDRDEPKVEWRPAGSLWGLSAREAEGQIRARTWSRLASCGDRSGGRTADSICHAQPRRPSCGSRRAGGRAGLEADQGHRREGQSAHAGG